MRFTVTSLAIVVLWVGGLCTAEEPSSPKKLEPRHALAKVEKDGTITIRHWQTVEQKVVVTEKRGGKEEQVEKYATKLEECLTNVAAKDVEGFETTGKKVEPGDLLKRIKKEPHVLVVWYGEVDPFFLKVIKAGTLTLVVSRRLGYVEPEDKDN